MAASAPATRGAGERPPLGDTHGRYELTERIATGGMAELFLARASGLKGFEKQVVLKRILPEFARDGEFVRLFLQEARLAATLHHANIVQVYDIGKVGESYFFTMEYVHGIDARRLLKRAMANQQPIPLEHAISIVVGAAAGLHYAHEKRDPDGVQMGLVHRDVSPSNILVGAEGAVKVLDFGIAKATHGRDVTKPGSVRGKVCYMSPEQCEGAPLDRRADIFALGILLYELTTTSLLFARENDLANMRQILEQEIPLPSTRRSDYPPELEQIVMRALRRQPAERYATAQELQRELERFAFHHRLPISALGLSEYIAPMVAPAPVAMPSVEEVTALDIGSAATARTGTGTVDPRTLERDPSAKEFAAALKANTSEKDSFAWPSFHEVRPAHPRLSILFAAAVALLVAGGILLWKQGTSASSPSMVAPSAAKEDDPPSAPSEETGLPEAVPTIEAAIEPSPAPAPAAKTPAPLRGKKRKKTAARAPAASPGKRSPDLVDPFGH